MTPDWAPLRRELAAWESAGMILPIWWRDDDAVTDTPALRRLIDLSTDADLPVHLAVIPRDADKRLAAQLDRKPRLIPLVHGWGHRNHAPAGTKKAEFGAHRAAADMTAEAARGLGRLSELFGRRLRPVFVPPWNRVSPAFAAALPALGYSALSTFGPRRSAQAAPDLAQVNTHLDPIDWHGTRSLADPDRLIAQMAEHLARRRTGRDDNAEPYGILTHHLVHDDQVWNFTIALLSRLRDGPTRGWKFDELTQAGDKG